MRYILFIFIIVFFVSNNALASRPEGCETSNSKVLQVDKVGFIVLAVSEYCSFGDVDYDKVKQYLRHESLTCSRKHNEKIISKLEDIQLNLPSFIKMYRDAIAWGEVEKNKPAEQLYAIAHEHFLNAISPEDWIYFVAESYLMIAADKGYKKALEELEDRNLELPEKPN